MTYFKIGFILITIMIWMSQFRIKEENHVIFCDSIIQHHQMKHTCKRSFYA